MGKYFGTDGFRGEANVKLTVEHAFKVGRYIGWYYGREKILEEAVICLSMRWPLELLHLVQMPIFFTLRQHQVYPMPFEQDILIAEL